MAKTNFLVVFTLSTVMPILMILLAFMAVLFRWLWRAARKRWCQNNCCGAPNENIGTLMVQKLSLGLLFVVYPQCSNLTLRMFRTLLVIARPCTLVYFLITQLPLCASVLIFVPQQNAFR